MAQQDFFFKDKDMIKRTYLHKNNYPGENKRIVSPLLLIHSLKFTPGDKLSL
jgi:hypothetical protein